MTSDSFIIGLLNMNITAAYTIAAIFLLRVCISRLPKKYSYALWSVAGIRLVLPFSLGSRFSLFNLPVFDEINTGRTARFVPRDIGLAAQPKVNTGISSVNSAVNSLLPPAPPYNSVNPMQIWLAIMLLVWLTGLAVIVGYEIYLHIKTKRLVKYAVKLESNVYECDNIPTPFVMGLIKPKIFIPFRLDKNERSYIICHEKYHIKRHDNIIKPIAFILLAVHWFNPFVWLAYILMNSDMEKSCDEAVLTHTQTDIKKDYSTSLLSFAVNKRHLPLGPLAFGETAVSSRIKNILKFKRPSRIVSLIGIAAVAVSMAVCVTNGTEKRGITEGQSVTGLANNKYLDRWAEAFCARNGHTIAEMTADNAVLDETVFERRPNGQGYEIPFGWSSPWPWGTDLNGNGIKTYEIIRDEAEGIFSPVKKGNADILYYAMTSDPHVWVWRENISYSIDKRTESFKATGENLEFFDAISSCDELYRAYPDNIKGTFMDYSANGLGEALNRNFTEDTDGFYSNLGDEKTAALYLLNISEAAADVIGYDTKADTRDVVIAFKADNKKVTVKMVQPFGKNGIWVPQEFYTE